MRVIHVKAHRRGKSVVKAYTREAFLRSRSTIAYLKKSRQLEDKLSRLNLRAKGYSENRLFQLETLHLKLMRSSSKAALILNNKKGIGSYLLRG